MKSNIIVTLLFSFLAAFSMADTYKQPCRVLGDDDYLQFTIVSSLALHSDFALKITAFEDEKCKIPYLNFNQYFKIDSLIENQINLMTQKVTYTAISQEVANALNMINYCEIKNWKAGIEIDVTGKLCDEFQQLQKNEKFYQILKSNQKSLKFGITTKELDGRIEANRPNLFDELDYIK